MGKVLVTADWHIKRGGCNWTRRPEITGDTAFGMRQIVNIARENGVTHVILAGDIFDKRMQYADALCEMRAFLDEVERSAINLLYVQGQHELSYPPLIAALTDKASHLDDHCVVINGKRIRGLDYKHPTEVRQALDELEECDVLVTHQVWKDFLGEDRGDAWISDIGCKPDTIITGDYHDLEVRNYQGQLVVSPGPISMQRINESPEKYVVIFDENWREAVHPLRGRKVYGVAMLGEAGLDSFIAEAPEQEYCQLQEGVPAPIQKNILVLNVPAGITDIEQRLAPLRRYVHLFLHIIHPEQITLPIPSEQRRQAVDAGLEGCLEAFYREDEELYREALQLLRAPDVRVAIGAIFEARVADGQEQS
jgi:predicted phosphodiesterase